MCEIFIIDPEENSTELIADNAGDMYDSNPDGLGIVAISRNEEEEKFDYDIFKDVEFNRDDVKEFVNRHKGAWRMVVHARLGTHGDKDIKQAHPITLDCDDCDIQAVVHNGVVSAEATWRTTLEDEGHEFSTEVDSEVIAHEHESVPEDIEDLEEPALSGSLNYILLQEDRVLVRSGMSYRDGPSMKMGKRSRCEWDDDGRSKKFVIAKPDGEVQMQNCRDTPDAEEEDGRAATTGWSQGNYRRSAHRRSTGNWTGGGSSGNRRSASNSNGQQGDSGTESSGPWQDWEDWPPQHLVQTN